MSTCALCGLEGHRYGTTDEKHEPNPTACVNGLRGHIEDLMHLVGHMVVAGGNIRVGTIREVLERGPKDLVDGMRSSGRGDAAG